MEVFLVVFFLERLGSCSVLELGGFFFFWS